MEPILLQVSAEFPDAFIAGDARNSLRISLREKDDRDRDGKARAAVGHLKDHIAVQRIRRGDPSERPRVVDDRREEVDGEHERGVVVETVYRRIVRRA